jgi:hypothetical protein
MYRQFRNRVTTVIDFWELLHEGLRFSKMFHDF